MITRTGAALQDVPGTSLSGVLRLEGCRFVPSDAAGNRGDVTNKDVPR